MTLESDPSFVLYASVSRGSTVLADLVPSGDDFSALAAICLDAAPRFHLFYTHTANRRIYAFLMADPLLFFTIADESLGRSAVLLFLHRLRDATVYIAFRRGWYGDPLPHHCLQDELVPVIRRLTAGLVCSSEEKKGSSPSLLSTPPSSDSHLLENKAKFKKEGKKNRKTAEEIRGSIGVNELEISVMDNDGDADLGLGLDRKSMQKVWRRQVRMVLVLDLLVCSLLFGIWLSVCKGFQCIGG